MSRRFTNARILILIVALVLSALAVGQLWAQGDDTSTTPTETPTYTPTPTNTPTYTPTPTNTPTYTPTPTNTSTYTPTPTNTPTYTPTPTLTPTSTPTEVPTETPAPTLTPTSTATVTPDATSVPASTATSVPASTTAPSAVPQLTVTQNEPAAITTGETATLSIIGTNFADTTSVRLVGYGFLNVSFINSTALTAAVPSSVPVGQYAVEVSDPTRGTVIAPTTLTVLAATVEATSTPVPTEVPGEPTLIVRTFSASPSSIYPGDTTQLLLEIVNVGSRTAEDAVVSLGQTSFAPANGQASVMLSDLGPLGSTVVYFSVTAPADASEGIASIPLTLTSHDFSGQSYSDSATLSVTILPETTGEAQVVLHSYSVTPETALPGDPVTVTATFKNSGTETASQVLVQLDSGGLLIAGSQGNSFSVGSLLPGASTTITMPLVVSNDAAAGVQAQSFTVSYLQDDDSRQTTVSLSLTVQQVVETTQVLLESYQVTPAEALPGDPVTVTATFTNSGTETASQVLVQLDAGSLLIAGSQGSSFSLGDLLPGASATLTMPLVVANDATAGVQAQSFTVSYLQGDSSQQTEISISLTVQQVVEGSSILLLQSYSTGQDDPLEPGQQFTYTMSLQNAGSLALSNLLVTLGQTQSSSGSSSSSSSTVNFAPLGSGDTTLLGDLSVGETTTLSQTFIVSNDLDSGVYQLPITVQYQIPDGTVTEQSMNASLVVVERPRLRVTLEDELDDPLTQGESYSVSVNIANLGASEVALTEMYVTGDNLTVTEGADILLDPLQSDDDTTETASITPDESGTYTLTVEVDYLDDLNQTQSFTTTFSGDVSEPAPPERPAPTATTTEEEKESNLVGRLLLGFFGFGG